MLAVLYKPNRLCVSNSEMPIPCKGHRHWHLALCHSLATHSQCHAPGILEKFATCPTPPSPGTVPCRQRRSWMGCPDRQTRGEIERWTQLQWQTNMVSSSTTFWLSWLTSQVHSQDGEATDSQHGNGATHAGEDEAKVVWPLPDLALHGLFLGPNHLPVSSSTGTTIWFTTHIAMGRAGSLLSSASWPTWLISARWRSTSSPSGSAAWAASVMSRGSSSVSSTLLLLLRHVWVLIHACLASASSGVMEERENIKNSKPLQSIETWNSQHEGDSNETIWHLKPFAKA